jgi:hypothetical protein
VGQARLAKMDLGVDHARQEMQPPAIDHLACRCTRQIANRLETAATNTEVAHTLTVMIDDSAAFEDQIVGISHARRCRERT